MRFKPDDLGKFNLITALMSKPSSPVFPDLPSQLQAFSPINFTISYQSDDKNLVCKPFRITCKNKTQAALFCFPRIYTDHILYT